MTLPALQASNHPAMTALLVVAGALYLGAWAMSLFEPRRARPALWAGVLAHGAAMAIRGVAIGFFPLTNKSESFSTFALAAAIALGVAWRRDRVRHEAAWVLPVVLASLAMSFRLGLDLGYPPPLMRTPWYPLHVPFSFLAYGAWTVAAATGVRWFRTPAVEVEARGADLERLHRLALGGLALWSLGMVCGGAWGVVAWGSYFLWDPKVVWSVILWIVYSSFVHVRLTPSLRGRPWVRPALSLVGFGCVLMAWLGTSLFFGANSHAWR